MSSNINHTTTSSFFFYFPFWKYKGNYNILDFWKVHYIDKIKYFLSNRYYIWSNQMYSYLELSFQVSWINKVCNLIFLGLRSMYPLCLDNGTNARSRGVVSSSFSFAAKSTELIEIKVFVEYFPWKLPWFEWGLSMQPFQVKKSAFELKLSVPSKLELKIFFTKNAFDSVLCSIIN